MTIGKTLLSLESLESLFEAWKRKFNFIQGAVLEKNLDNCFLILLVCQFTKEVEQDQSLPFLDIKINRNQDGTLSTSVFRKPTYSGLYLNWRSYVSKQYKLGLVRCLLHRAWSICSSSELFESEVSFIRSILRANGYPLNFLNSCIIKFKKMKYNEFKKMKYNDIVPDSGVQFGPKRKDVYINLPFKGEQSHNAHNLLALKPY